MEPSSFSLAHSLPAEQNDQEPGSPLLGAKPMRAEDDKRQFFFIDALRGVCALLVLYFHLVYHIFYGGPEHSVPRGTLSYYFVAGAFDLGKYAVAIFFIISGFLIPSTLSGTNPSLGRYVIHRLFRLYPAYWVSLAVAIFLPLLSTGHVGVPLLQALVNVTMLQKFVGVPDAIGAYWTLQIELVFYFLCGALFVASLLTARLQMIYVALAAAMVTAAGRYVSGRELPVALFIALSLMFLGDMIRAYLRGSVDLRKLLYGLTCVGCCLIPICGLAYGTGAGRYVLTYYMAIATFFVALRSSRTIASNAFLRPILSFLGEISYGVYLLHSPIGLAVAGYLFRRTGSRMLSGTAAFGLTIAGAYLVFVLVERPCIKLGKKLGDGVTGRGKTPANISRLTAEPIAEMTG